MVGILAFALVVGALIVHLGDSGAGRGGVIGAGTTGTPGGSGVKLPGTPGAVRAGMLDYFFPTDGADFAAGFRFSNWEGAVVAKTTDRCLTAAGFPGTSTSAAPLVYSGDNTEFPDLGYLSQHGFLVTEAPAPPGTIPTQGMSTSRASAYRSADRTCRASAAAGVNSLIRTGAPLQEQWMNVVTAIDAGPQFQEALVGWQACTQRAGVDVTTLSAFFDYADSQATHGGSAQDSVHLARIYVTCLAPAEAVRDRLRQEDRVSFFTDHAGAIPRLTSLLVPLEAQPSQ